MVLSVRSGDVADRIRQTGWLPATHSVTVMVGYSRAQD